MNDVSTPIAPLAEPFLLPGNQIGIVMVHGYGGTIADYRALADLLNATGYSVFGLRLAGHGQGPEALRRSTVPEWQQSVTDVVAEARRKCAQVFLLGSSFGGVLVLDYVAEHQDLAGMILVNTALSYSGAGIFQGLILRVMKLFTPDYPKKGLSEPERQMAERIGSSKAWPIDGIIATSRFAKLVAATKLALITTPALIMRSNHDPVVGTKNSERLASLLGSTQKELVTIPIVTHRPFRNQEANLYMATQVNHFIKRLLAET